MTPPTTTSGTRLRCDVCNAEFIVLTAAPADIRCCDRAPTVVSPGRTSA